MEMCQVIAPAGCFDSPRPPPLPHFQEATPPWPQSGHRAIVVQQCCHHLLTLVHDGFSPVIFIKHKKRRPQPLRLSRGGEGGVAGYIIDE